MNIKPYTKSSFYCDSHCSSIVELAVDITRGVESEREKAVLLFCWVRDNIKYSVGNWSVKASKTLKIKTGTCTNKSNLLVALLRSQDIPAGFGVMKVKGKEYFGPIALPMLRKWVNKSSVHIYSVVYLESRFVRCDPSDDALLCKKTSFFNPTTKLVKWNGLSDAMLNLSPEHIIEDRSPWPSIDHLMQKKSKLIKLIPIRIANHYLDYLRFSDSSTSDIIEIQKNFIVFLKRHKPVVYFLYVILDKIYNKGNEKK